MSSASPIPKDYLTSLENRIRRLEEIVLRKSPNAPHAQELLMKLGKKLEAAVDKQGLTEEQLFKDLKQTRKKVFEETYGDIAR